MKFYRKTRKTPIEIRTGNGSYSPDGKHRYSLDLTWKNSRKRKALAIGINPSKANDEKSDNTLSRLAIFLDQFGFDGYTIINLFSSYSTHQSGIDRSSICRLESFMDKVKSVDAIIIVWGLADEYIEEKLEMMEELKPWKDKLFCLENHQKKTPAHPARMAYSFRLVPFDWQKHWDLLNSKIQKSSRKP